MIEDSATDTQTDSINTMPTCSNRISACLAIRMQNSTTMNAKQAILRISAKYGSRKNGTSATKQKLAAESSLLPAYLVATSSSYMARSANMAIAKLMTSVSINSRITTIKAIPTAADMMRVFI